MAAGTKTTKGSPRRRQLKISYVETANTNEYQLDEAQKERKPSSRSPTTSRKGRVHPESNRERPRSGKAMAMADRNGDEPKKRRNSKNKPNLTVDTTGLDERRQQSSTPKTPANVRGSRDLRSPGVQKSPVAQTAKLQQQSGGQALPDFITQTDANGNAITPRSAKAIDGARKTHPSGPKPRLHVDRKGRLTEDDDSERDGDHMDDPCDNLLDSLRLMCCCFMVEDEKRAKCLSGGSTQDSEDKDRVRLLGPHHPDDAGKKCLVLDLDETLVHSSFRAVPNADFVIPVQIEDVVHFVYVAKRPGVDEFLIEMAKHYEVVIYTASLNKYADPLLDLLDPHNVIRSRLFRESCVYYEGNYVKDLSLLDRDLANTIIIDNSPSSYMFHPENAIDCSSFIDCPKDRELDQIGAFLTGIKDVKDVRGVAPQWKEWPVINLGPGEAR